MDEIKQLGCAILVAILIVIAAVGFDLAQQFLKDHPGLVPILLWGVGLAGFGLLVCVPVVLFRLHRAEEGMQARLSAAWEREERRKEAAEQHRRAQACRQQMVALGTHSVVLFELIQKHLAAAEQYLDLAEVYFKARRFERFWGSVEEAVQALARFDAGVRQINGYVSSYNGLVKQYQADPPPFPISRPSVERLAVGSVTAERMQEIVAKAESDIEFAEIYSLRRMNQTLVAGFTNMAQAQEQMSWRITASIGDLAGSVETIRAMLWKPDPP
jgi:hypothetical protein